MNTSKNTLLQQVLKKKGRNLMSEQDSQRSALLIIDVQNDFCKNGSLEVPDANSIIPLINKIRTHVPFYCIILSQDWHPLQHASFASNHPNASPFQTMELKGLNNEIYSQVAWPNHCVQDTTGAEFHRDLLWDSKSDLVVKKGTNVNIDSYSAFFDNRRENKTILDDLLKERNIKSVFVCGLALDYCVAYTALDAKDLGYETTVIEDACRGIDSQSIEKMKQEMKNKNVRIMQSGDIWRQIK